MQRALCVGFSEGAEKVAMPTNSVPQRLKAALTEQHLRHG